MQPETISSGLCYGGIDSGRSLDRVEFDRERAIVSIENSEPAFGCDRVLIN
ncbi:hypothetical protein QUA00_31635 [Microcoleus sp. T2B6]|uniref:hypothetical protein n=1 Tax=Microcoleus sp. T2B6 TaxID=3055424 RepID=UPI002FD56AFA